MPIGPVRRCCTPCAFLPCIFIHIHSTELGDTGSTPDEVAPHHDCSETLSSAHSKGADVSRERCRGVIRRPVGSKYVCIACGTGPTVCVAFRSSSLVHTLLRNSTTMRTHDLPCCSHRFIECGHLLLGEPESIPMAILTRCPLRALPRL